MARLFWPLALSALLMSACNLVVAAGVARLPEAAVALAAVGIVASLAILVESPIIAILSTSIALGETRAAARLVWRFMVIIGLAQTLLSLLVFFTPLYDVVAGGVLGLPAPVAAAAAPALQLMLLWPLAIGWRRYYQGLLIRQGRTAIIGWGTLARLLSTALVVFWLGPALGWPGAMVGALAMVVGVVVEAGLMTPPGLLAARRLPPGATALTLGEIGRYHWPLAATNLMRVVTAPLVSAALARGALPTLSLAAWPLVSSTVLLLGSATVPLQELAIATVRDRASQRRLLGFTSRVGMLLLLGLVLLVATPLLDLYLGAVLGAPPEVRAVAAVAVVWLLPAPLLLAVQSAARGVLASRRRTSGVGWAMAVNLMVLAAWLAGWVGLGLGPGVIGAATALVVATAVEVIVLWRLSLARPPLTLAVDDRLGVPRASDPDRASAP